MVQTSFYIVCIKQENNILYFSNEAWLILDNPNLYLRRRQDKVDTELISLYILLNYPIPTKPRKLHFSWKSYLKQPGRMIYGLGENLVS